MTLLFLIFALILGALGIYEICQRNFLFGTIFIVIALIVGFGSNSLFM